MSAQSQKVLPTLYKKTATGADQEWTIWTEGNVIVTRWGQVGGAIQETRDVIETGKNIGRSNETTPEQQAVAEAQSQWEKKLKKGYVQNLEDARAGKVDAIIEGGISPMLAEKFDEQEHKLVYPLYVQPKLDGHRCIAILDEKGKCTLWSRTRKPITSMSHIQAALESLGMHSVIFDGELYNHDYKDRFEELTSFIRNTEFQPGADSVQYHIYDLPSGWTFARRWHFLLEYVKGGHPLHIVSTTLAHSREHLMSIMDQCLEAGYEGAMARNAEGLYVNKRSIDLQKVKVFNDAEFPVVGVEEGRGKLKGHAIFVCKTTAGVEFRAKLKGSQAELKKYFDNPGLAIGRQLTVKYQGITNKNGVPRFPVALRFREDV